MVLIQQIYLNLTQKIVFRQCESLPVAAAVVVVVVAAIVVADCKGFGENYFDVVAALLVAAASNCIAVPQPLPQFVAKEAIREATYLPNYLITRKLQMLEQVQHCNGKI